MNVRMLEEELLITFDGVRVKYGRRRLSWTTHFWRLFFIIDNILSKKSEVLDMSNLSRGQVRIENT